VALRRYLDEIHSRRLLRQLVLRRRGAPVAAQTGITVCGGCKREARGRRRFGAR
jgi:hypothetical protein